MDAAGITASMQSSTSDDDDDDMAAPDAAVYGSSSVGILDTLNGLLEKGETQFNTATATESTNKNNFDQRNQALIDEINKDLVAYRIASAMKLSHGDDGILKPRPPAMVRSSRL